jgi:hypothetical protein
MEERDTTIPRGMLLEIRYQSVQWRRDVARALTFIHSELILLLRLESIRANEGVGSKGCSRAFDEAGPTDSTDYTRTPLLEQPLLLKLCTSRCKSRYYPPDDLSLIESYAENPARDDVGLPTFGDTTLFVSMVPLAEVHGSTRWREMKRLVPR